MAIYNLSNQPQKTQKEKKDNSKAIGITLIAISSLSFFALLTNLLEFLKIFIMGMLGYFSFPIAILAFVIGVALVNKKKYVMTVKYVVFLTVAIMSIVCILHLAFIDKSGTFFEYIGRSYTAQNTVGGIVAGILTAPILFILNSTGAYILFSAVFIIFAGLIADYIYYLNKSAKTKKAVAVRTPIPTMVENTAPVLPVKKIEQKQEVVKEKPVTEEKTNIVLGAKVETTEDSARRKLGLIKSSKEEKPQEQPKQEEKKPSRPSNIKEYLLTPETKIDMSRYSSKNNIDKVNTRMNQLKNSNQTTYSSVNNSYSSNNNSNSIVSNSMPSKVIHEDSSFNIKKESEVAQKPYFAPMPEFNTPVVEEKIEPVAPVVKPEPVKQESSTQSLLDDLIKQTQIDINQEPIKPESGRRGFKDFGIDDLIKETPKPEPIKPIEQPKPIKKDIRYNAPTLNLLTTESMDLSELNDDIMAKREQLEIALDTFGIPAKVVEVVIGPSVTRYELEMPPGISVKKVLAHSDDIALNLASNGDIRIEAPIPGKSAVGIEVPNASIATVGLKEMLASDEFRNCKAPLTFAMGKDINGNVKLCNLQKMPHLLVAGATNSGKSVCLNAIILSLIYRLSPDEMKLILIDPKRVEFTMYNNLPHLLLPNVVTESDKALNALNWAVNEMERRYALFQKTKTRNYDEYKVCNEVLEGVCEKLPFVVIIIDELADLLMTAKKEVEEKIMRLAQKARAAGIHLILATQRPSVDVITGTIKANFPSRISFALTSFADSKTILEQSGAEKLLGKGDMLYKPSDAAEPKRIQGCFVTSKEVDTIVEYVKENNKEYDYDTKIEDAIMNPQKANAYDNSASGDGDVVRTTMEPLVPKVLKYFIENNQASTSLIQRKFVVGYQKAARIMDQLQDANYISPPDGSKPRQILITMEEYLKIFGEND